jgi:hypothetical protein
MLNILLKKHRNKIIIKKKERNKIITLSSKLGEPQYNKMHKNI